MVRVSFVPALFLALACPAWAQETPPAANGNSVTLTPAQLFSVADQARDRGEFDVAEAAYKALADHPDPELRREARFRLAKMWAGLKRFNDAATLYRAILDEKPDAQPVRLELAAVLALMGKEASARRELRAAQAGGLPPEVAQLVDQFSAAMRAARPYGASFEIALAPSSNINRATSATTLDTIIAPFELSRDGRAQSGTGVKLGGQLFARLPVADGTRLIARASGQGNFYKQSQFEDVIGSGELGVELTLGKWRVRPQAGRSWRWFGQSLYATTNTASLNIIRPAGRKAQIEADMAVGFANYRQNNLQDGRIYSASLGYERAFNAKTGAGLTISGQRQTAADPGYATWSGGASLLVWREIAGTTVYASAGLSRLKSDARLFLFPDKRREWSTRAMLGANLRKLQVAGFSPVIRLSYEKNSSTVGLYRYKRTGAELGISRAF